MTHSILLTLIFILCYLGMGLGRIPKTRLGRSGIALFSALLVLLSGALPATQLPQLIELPTLIILFALMLLSAQLELADFYKSCAARIASYAGAPAVLLALVIFVSGFLSAFLANDIIAFAMTPLLCRGLAQRGLDARPFLFGLMGACNAGSAATMIGNPQNILIAEYGRLHFLTFLKTCAPPALIALVIVYLCVWLIWRHHLIQRPVTACALPPVDQTQTWLGFMLTLVLIVLFLSPVPRLYSCIVLIIALLLCRYRQPLRLLALADWRLLLLFVSLFIVNAGFSSTGYPNAAVAWLQQHGLHLEKLTLLVPFALLTSNTIGNVPAVIMTLSLWRPLDPHFLYALSLFMTLAGNALLLGSLANIIVAERAKMAGCALRFCDHLRAGLPMALLSIGAAWLWLNLK